MFNLQLTSTGFPSKRAFNAAKRAVFRDVGLAWHERYRALHFDAGATARYGYYLRKGEGLPPGSKGRRRSYTGRKERLFGHARPLVFTGETERASRLVDVRATATGGRVVLPRKLNLRHPKSRISMRDEVTRVLPAEAAALVELADRQLQARLREQPAETKTKTKTL